MILVVMETILAGNYEFRSYQNVCIYKMAWLRVNTLTRVSNHISLEGVEHQHSVRVCGVCIITLGVDL